MAVAEARAAWQRTVQRCLVQEDAKRAPKLACCPSASLLVKQVDVEHTRGDDDLDIPPVGLLPYPRNPAHSNFYPNSRWWLHLQPNNRYNEASEMEMSQNDTSSTSCDHDSGLLYESVETESFVDIRIPTTGQKNDFEVEKQELKTTCAQTTQDFSNTADAKDLNDPVETVPTTCAISNKVNDFFYDSGSPWDGSGRTEPWWRTADRDELALLVSQRSFGLVENCDLPRPQKTYSKGETFADLCCLDHDGTCLSSKDSKHFGLGHAFPFCNKALMASVDVPLQPNPLSSKEASPKRIVDENVPGKAQLLEALCHSQTRAREAEKVAKQAYAEKEHVMKLVFRQASQLFAYKQWFQLLQLENLYYQIKSKQNESISTLLPVMLPWVPQKSRKPWKNRQRGTRGKRAKKGHPRGGLNKYAVVFALGLSLVGAGLLLGWTVGCLFPTF